MLQPEHLSVVPWFISHFKSPWPSYLTSLLGLRLVESVGAKITARSSYSQWHNGSPQRPKSGFWWGLAQWSSFVVPTLHTSAPLYEVSTSPNSWHILYFCFLLVPVRGWTSAFLLDVHRLSDAIEGRLRHFLPRWFRTGWQVWSAREKSLEILHCGWELNPGHGEDRQCDTFILPLSYHDPGHGEDRQWDTFILPLSYHDPGHGEDRQWDTFILPLSYHWAGLL